MISAVRVEPGGFPAQDNLFQTSFWGTFKTFFNQKALYFFVTDSDLSTQFPLLVFLRKSTNGSAYAYVPKGPSISAKDGEYGLIIENISLAIKKFLPADCVCIRFDVPWKSPFSLQETPRIELRELRMNFGTSTSMIRKSPLNHICPDTVLIDLRLTPEQILLHMRQTTRNCIRHAYRSDVSFSIISPFDTDSETFSQTLEKWHKIYEETALRKHFFFEKLDYFKKLFSVSVNYNQSNYEKINNLAGELKINKKNKNEILPLKALVPPPKFYLCTAQKDGEILSGLILCTCEKAAYYMYSGSSLSMRDCMPNYGLQWETILFARTKGCTKYDLLGIPPDSTPSHPMNGLYIFKTGLGGEHVRYSGCWDYVFDEERYSDFVQSEQLASGLTSL